MEELKRIIEESEVTREDDNLWPEPDRIGRQVADKYPKTRICSLLMQELEIKMNGEHISFTVCSWNVTSASSTLPFSAQKLALFSTFKTLRIPKGFEYFTMSFKISSALCTVRRLEESRSDAFENVKIANRLSLIALHFKVDACLRCKICTHIVRRSNLYQYSGIDEGVARSL